MQKIGLKLFSQQPNFNFRIVRDKEELIPTVTTEDLKKTYAKIGNQNAQRRDRIPNITLKEAINKAPDIVVHMYYKCLQKGYFPTEWKQHRLVFLPKWATFETGMKSILIY